MLRIKASPMRKKVRVQFDTTEVKLRGRLPASIKLMSAFNLLLRESSLFNIEALRKTLASCCSDSALRELKTDYWAFIMKKTNLSIDVIREKLAEADALIPREPTPDDELEEADQPAESNRTLSVVTADPSPVKLVEALGSPMQEEAKIKVVSPPSMVKVDAAPAPRKSFKFAKKVSSLKLEEDNEILSFINADPSVGPGVRPNTDQNGNPSLKKDPKADKKPIQLEEKSDQQQKAKKPLLEIKTEDLSSRERTLVYDNDPSVLNLNSLTFEARRTSDIDLDSSTKPPIIAPIFSFDTELAKILKHEIPEYMRGLSHDELEDSTSQPGNLSQNQESAFKSATDSDQDKSKSPKPIDYSRETPISVLTSSDLSLSSSEFYSSLRQVYAVKEDAFITDMRLKLPLPSLSNESNWSLDDDAEDGDPVNMPTYRTEIFNHKQELFKPRHLLVQDGVGESLEEHPQERDDIIECCSCECSCSDSQCLLI